MLDIVLILLALALCLLGLVGAVVPAIPGPPLSWVGLLLMVFCPSLEISFPIVPFMLLALLVMVIVTVLDFVAPVWITKRVGGTKAGTNGATIGMVLGVAASCFGFFPGVLIGPFLGAYCGELMAGVQSGKAFKVACYSFLSFILTTGLKMLYGFAALFFVVYEGFSMFFR